MKAKGVIKKQVDWKTSRKFFFWRLKRRLAEFELVSSIGKTNFLKLGANNRKEIMTSFHGWFLDCGGSVDIWENDREFTNWMDQNASQVKSFVSKHQFSKLGSVFRDVISQIELASDDQRPIIAMRDMLSGLSSNQKSILLSALKDN